MKTLNKFCLNCNKEFLVLEKEIRRGNGKFCSRKCSGENRSKTYVRPRPNCVCAQCSTKFYRNNSKQKNSKSGLFFCERSCKDKAQRLDGIADIQPSHYGNGHSHYRKIAFRSKDKCCEGCGYNNYPILVVHHNDRDRTNNNITNLKILCPSINCFKNKYNEEKNASS